MTANHELIGRDEINDLEAILSVSNTDVDAVVHTVGANFDTVFTWDYERSRPALVKLYEKAKTSQWNVTTDLDWSISVDQEALALEDVNREDVRFFGENVTRLPAQERIRRGLRRTYQISLPFRGLTVRDSLYLAVRGVSRGRFSLVRPRRDDGDSGEPSHTTSGETFSGAMASKTSGASGVAGAWITISSAALGRR